jgi:hypothetical protein
MPKCTVWNPDEADEEDGRTVEAFGVDDAALKFAERQCHRDTDYYGSYESGVVLNVKDEDGVVHPVNVYVRSEPQFYTSPVTRIPAARR